EHRIGVNLHALPGGRVSDVVGMPPLHFKIDKGCARAPRHGDAVARHFARSGRTSMQPIGISGREDNRTRKHDLVPPRHDVQCEHPAYRPVWTAQQRSNGALFQSGNSRLDHLLAAQVHERHAGIALQVCSNAADLAGTGDHVAFVVPTQIKASFLKLRVVHVLDPMAASTCPMLIDKELVVILDQELGGIARVLLGIPQSAPRKHEVACEDRGPTLADETLANDYRPDAVTMEIERGVAPGCPSADDDNICGLDLHYSNNREMLISTSTGNAH